MLDETKLFDFIKIMFTKPGEYKKIKKYNKKRHHFMVNRFFAIKFPANAQLFNHNGINPIAVIDSWSLVANRFKGVPGWIYTKTKRAKKAKKSKEYEPSETVIQYFMEKNEIGTREYNELLKFAKTELYNNLQKIEQSIQVY
jgi:hypothetical protein